MRVCRGLILVLVVFRAIVCRPHAAVFWLRGVGFNYCCVYRVFYMERSQTRWTPPCHTKAATEERVVSSSHVLVCGSGALFSLVSLVTTGEAKMGRWGKRLHITGWDANRGHWKGEWRQGKVYKAAFIWVDPGHEERAGFHQASVLLCLS